VLVQVTSLKAECTWVIIIDDTNSGFDIASLKFDFGVRVIKLKVEVLIGFPVVIIKDIDSDFLIGLIVVKIDDLINRFIIFASNGVAIDGTNTNFAGFLSFIYDFNANIFSSLTNRVVEAEESPAIVFDTLFHF